MYKVVYGQVHEILKIVVHWPHPYCKCAMRKLYLVYPERGFMHFAVYTACTMRYMPSRHLTAARYVLANIHVYCTNSRKVG